MKTKEQAMPTDQKPLTMSAEREADIRRWPAENHSLYSVIYRELITELDATRAALAETRERLEYWAGACKEAQQYRDNNAAALEFAEKELAETREQVAELQRKLGERG